MHYKAEWDYYKKINKIYNRYQWKETYFKILDRSSKNKNIIEEAMIMIENSFNLKIINNEAL
jgi:IS4 transposase